MMLQRICAGDARARGRRSRRSSRVYDAAHRRARRVRAAATRRRGGSSDVGATVGEVVAYFSAEFALHQSLPIYAGGLGVLAGDHCKEASDLGVPLVGVGFMYPQGYFRQRVSPEGWQQEVYEQLDWDDAPIERGADASTASRASCWCRSATAACSCRSGRCGSAACACCLLDTDLEAERAVGSRAVGAPVRRRPRTRVCSRKSCSASAACWRCARSACSPAVWHLNEGHAAFVVLQRIRDLLADGLDVGRRARRSAADDGLHDAHAGAGRPRRVPVPPGRAAPGGLLGIDGRPRRAVPRARQLRQRPGPAVQHDGARDAVGGRDQRREPAARRGHARDVRAALAGPAPATSGRSRAITNGVHVPTWVSRRRWRGSSSGT